MSDSRPYVDFYEAHKIIPVRQDLSDLNRHFARRRALYHHLGLLPGLVRGRSVLEIGPGTGDNALHTASLGPARYVMMDGNSLSIAAVRAKAAAGDFGTVPVDIRHGDALALMAADGDTYDVVLCEGLLPAQTDQAAFLRALADRVAPGGVLVVTTVSYTSLFPETCRRALRPLFERQAADLPDLVARLVAFFKPDLQSLPGMSRLHEDWVMDQIIHPYGKNAAFSLGEAVATLGDAFTVAGTSPRFLQDWRWYKSVPAATVPETERVRAEIAAWSLGMIDYRRDPVAVDPAVGQAVEDLAKAAWEAHVDLLADPELVAFDTFLDLVRTTRDQLPSPYTDTARSLDAYLAAAAGMLKGEVGDFSGFQTLFGRGQQYLMVARQGS